MFTNNKLFRYYTNSLTKRCQHRITINGTIVVVMSSILDTMLLDGTIDQYLTYKTDVPEKWTQSRYR